MGDSKLFLWFVTDLAEAQTFPGEVYQKSIQSKLQDFVEAKTRGELLDPGKWERGKKEEFYCPEISAVDSHFRY